MAAETGAHVVAGSLRNASAVAAWTSKFETAAVVPAGERWPNRLLRPALEDMIGAGAIIQAMDSRKSPEAMAAVAAYDAAEADLRNELEACSYGRQLIERGFPGDVELAVELNACSTVPILVDKTFTRHET
jgi:2-phosphosulfolactate phosphatase